MAYRINICLDSAQYPKCQGCPHHRKDPERQEEYSCYIDQDLKGPERLAYLQRLLDHYEKEERLKRQQVREYKEGGK